jgi:UDP-N-acetylglucosamine 4,6-dehydratase
VSSPLGSEIKNKTLGITGGTGSFGNVMLARALETDVSEIRIISRDEEKQDAMRRRFSDERIKFYVTDVRERITLESAIDGCDYIFHAAALKQVPTGEFFPGEVIKTNTLGSQNLFESAIKYKVSKVIALSTDKAVYPINAMGMSKALMEKFAYSYSREGKSSSTIIAVTRYGNVMCSRGSVIPKFYSDIMDKNEISITDPKMTRFLMSLNEAINLVLYAFSHAKQGDLFVRKAPAATVETLANGIAILLNKSPSVNLIGIRHGEKSHETLLSREEAQIAEDQGEYFRVPTDVRGLDYEKYFDLGTNSKNIKISYTSENTTQLTSEEVAVLLEELPEFMRLRNTK